MQNFTIFRVALSATRCQALEFASLSARRQLQDLVVVVVVVLAAVTAATAAAAATATAAAAAGVGPAAAAATAAAAAAATPAPTPIAPAHAAPALCVMCFFYCAVCYCAILDQGYGRVVASIFITGIEPLARVIPYLTDKNTFIVFFYAAKITIPFRINIENVNQHEIL